MTRRLSSRTALWALAAVLLAAAAGGHPAYASEAAAVLEIKEEQYIVNPAGDSVVMIFDLFAHQAKLKAIAAPERPTAARLLATRVLDHYLATLPKSEAAGLKSANVALVYIPKRNEYQNPDLSSLQQLGMAKMAIKDGRSAIEGEVVGSLQF
jgi:hypothetical protein